MFGTPAPSSSHPLSPFILAKGIGDLARAIDLVVVCMRQADHPGQVQARLRLEGRLRLGLQQMVEDYVSVWVHPQRASEGLSSAMFAIDTAAEWRELCALPLAPAYGDLGLSSRPAAGVGLLVRGHLLAFVRFAGDDRALACDARYHEERRQRQAALWSMARTALRPATPLSPAQMAMAGVRALLGGQPPGMAEHVVFEHFSERLRMLG